MTELKNRYEFVVLFDVENGNPNGDPDAGNMPRIDAETSRGLVTDVCIKRKIRNYVETVKNDETGYKIYVKEGVALNSKNKTAYESLGVKPKTEKENADKEATEFMCKHFFDIRTFGAVMTTKINCGQVRGPVQLNFASSIDPIVQSELTITRQVDTDKDNSKTMGRKHIVPYGLYRAEGYVSARLAQQTGFSEEDLGLLFEAIENMFEHDHSAARGKMGIQKLIIFKHESELGNTQAHKLFDLIEVKKKDAELPPRAFEDYEVTIKRENLPQGVELIERV